MANSPPTEAAEPEVLYTLFPIPSTPQSPAPAPAPAPTIPPHHHRVYTIYTTTSGPHHSQSLFLETNTHGPLSGIIYHVIGSLNKGMQFETHVDLDPTQSPDFESRVFLGSIAMGEQGRFEAVVRGVEVPGRQVRRGGKVVERERGKGLKGGREWVAEVVERLYREGVVVR
jgi:hypothetical protein